MSTASNDSAIVLCSWTRYFTLRLVLAAKEYKWVMSAGDLLG